MRASYNTISSYLIRQGGRADLGKLEEHLMKILGVNYQKARDIVWRSRNLGVLKIG